MVRDSFIIGLRKDIGLSTKIEPKSTGRVGLSVRDEYPGRHTNCPLSTDFGALFPNFFLGNLEKLLN